MIKAIILDFDDTLVETSSLLDKKGKNALIDFLVLKTGKPKKEIKKYVLPIMKKEDSMHEVSKKACEHYGIIYKQAHNTIVDRIDLTSLTIPEDTKKFVKKIEEYSCFIVSTGSSNFQMKKIKKVGLQDIGTIIIDHFSKEGKKNIFKKILKKYKPEEVLCIGDNIQSEIFTANKLGMHTIRILKGKRKKLIRRNKYEKPEFTVKKLMEIPALIRKIENKNQKILKLKKRG